MREGASKSHPKGLRLHNQAQPKTQKLQFLQCIRATIQKINTVSSNKPTKFGHFAAQTQMSQKCEMGARVCVGEGGGERRCVWQEKMKGRNIPREKKGYLWGTSIPFISLEIFFLNNFSETACVCLATKDDVSLPSSSVS